MVDGIFSILASYSFTFLPVLPRTSQTYKHRIKYELGFHFSITLQVAFLKTNFWENPSFLLGLTCFFFTTMSHISKSLIIFTLFCTSLCLSLLSYTKMLNRSLCLNISCNAVFKWFKSFYPSEVTSLDLDDDRPIGDGNSLLIATTDRKMSVPSTGPEFQAYHTKNNPCNYW